MSMLAWVLLEDFGASILLSGLSLSEGSPLLVVLKRNQKDQHFFFWGGEGPQQKHTHILLVLVRKS